MKTDSVKITLNGKKVGGSLINKEGKVNITFPEEVLIQTGAILEVVCS
jgi:hypothetical protein